MLDIKECRRIKNEYTKKYEGKNVILNLNHYPFIYMIVTHGDGKSWGYFAEYFNNEKCESHHKKRHIFLSRSNNEMVYFYTHHGEHYYNANTNVIIECDNEDIKRVYNIIFIKNFVYGVNGSWLAPLSFEINPRLTTNLYDAGIINNDYAIYFPYGLHNSVDISKPLIKDAFHGLNAKWAKVAYEYGISVEKIKKLKQFNYQPEEISSGFSNFDIPDLIIRNKEATFKFVSDYYYRDYIRMYEQLPAELRNGFTIFPKDIRKKHDDILKLYQRHQDAIAELRRKEVQENYLKNYYDKAKSFEYKDATYQIIACKDLGDLVKEGRELHHCVGSYINSVGKGSEYILFLRKIDNIETPFFTIDLTPDLIVRQIHGLRNCNLSDEVKPFVNKWAEKFNLNISSCSGIYCAIN